MDLGAPRPPDLVACDRPLIRRPSTDRYAEREATARLRPKWALYAWRGPAVASAAQQLPPVAERQVPRGQPKAEVSLLGQRKSRLVSMT